MKWISNKTLYNIHGWLGLNIGLLLFVICFSGTFATLSIDVDWLLNKNMRVEHQDGPVQWEVMYRNLRMEYPEGTLRGIYKHTFDGHDDHFATTAYMSLPNGQTRKVFLNHFTGEIQGDSSFFDVYRFFRDYHRRFFDGMRGIYLVTLTSFFLLFSVLTGFLFYKGWLKNLFKLRFARGIKVLWSDLHKFTGIWSLIFALLVALTGIFYFVEQVINSSGNSEWLQAEVPAPLQQEDLEGFGHTLSLLPLDEYVANAKEAYPELDVISIRIPHQPWEYVYIDGKAGSLFTRNRANKVYLHPFTGDVVHVQRDSDLTTAGFITDMADPLHFGYFGGLPTRILWFIFGLGISVSILSGAYLWYIRRMEKLDRKFNRARKRNEEKREDRNKKGMLVMAGFFVQYLTLSRGAVLSVVLTLFYLISIGGRKIPAAIQFYGPLPVERFEKIDTLGLGPWTIDVECEYPCRFGKGTLLLRFREEGIPNYTSLELEVTSEEGRTQRVPFSISPVFSGSGKWPSLALSEVDLATEGTTGSMQIRAETPGGQVFTGGIAMERFKEAQDLLNKRFEAYPERSYPDVPLRVYLYLLFFALCTLSIMGLWTWFLVRATSRKRFG